MFRILFDQVFRFRRWKLEVTVSRAVSPTEFSKFMLRAVKRDYEDA